MNIEVTAMVPRKSVFNHQVTATVKFSPFILWRWLGWKSFSIKYHGSGKLGTSGQWYHIDQPKPCTDKKVISLLNVHYFFWFTSSDKSNYKP